MEYFGVITLGNNFITYKNTGFITFNKEDNITEFQIRIVKLFYLKDERRQ